MGKTFGNLAKIRGIVTYRLSPFEQKAFTGFFVHGFPNTLRRIWGSLFIVGGPMTFTYLLYAWANKEHARLQRKNPKDFENDE